MPKIDTPGVIEAEPTNSRTSLEDTLPDQPWAMGRRRRNHGSIASRVNHLQLSRAKLSPSII